MTPPTWMYGPVIALGLVQLLGLAVTLWLGTGWSDREDQGEVGDRVACPNCEAANEWGYRYCRRCVSELPGPSPYAQSNGRPRPASPL